MEKTQALGKKTKLGYSVLRKPEIPLRQKLENLTMCLKLPMWGFDLLTTRIVYRSVTTVGEPNHGNGQMSR